MASRQIKDFLEREAVTYEVLPHRQAYTAQGMAASLHVSGREVAKPVILKARNGRVVMAVVPGPRRVDVRAVEELFGSPLELASEDEMARLFPDCELGAEPPLGNLYGMPVYADESLLKDREIVFNAGTHTEAIRMRRED